MSRPIPLLAALLAALGTPQRPAEDLAEPLPAAEELAVPCASGARFPDLAEGLDGALYLCWTEPAGEGEDPEQAHRLAVARLGEQGWERLADAASGPDWFVNWADFPTVAALADGTLAAHVLVRSGEGGHDYDALVVRSLDAGASWTEPAPLHDDLRPAEHGFVSLVGGPAGFTAVWLDGRARLEGGATALRARTLRRDGGRGPEVVLDGRVCDCCQTALVDAGDGRGGLVVAYRDRGEDELRDVAWMPLGSEALAGGRVPAPRALHADGWRIAGCPVNGPALAAHGERLAAAWFTVGNDDRPRVRARLAVPGGEARVVELAGPGERPEGRVDVAFDGGGDPWVSWLERREQGGAWRLARIDWGRGEVGTAETLAPVPSAEREVGFGRLASHDGALVFAFTEPVSPGREGSEGEPGAPGRVRTLRLR